MTGQADAIRLGIARALCQLDIENRKPLKTEGYLTRDPRAKERRKYGLRKARKAPNTQNAKMFVFYFSFVVRLLCQNRTFIPSGIPKPKFIVTVKW